MDEGGVTMLDLKVGFGIYREASIQYQLPSSIFLYSTIEKSSQLILPFIGIIAVKGWTAVEMN